MSEDNSQPPALPDKKRWWGMWMVSSVALPAVAGACGSLNSDPAGIFALVLAMISLVLHEQACKRLAPPKSLLYFFLVIGGGALMASSLYSGCLVFRTHP